MSRRFAPRHLAALCLLSACTTHRLPPTFPEPKAPTAEEVLAALTEATRPVERSVAVGVSEDGKRLICWDLETGAQAWSHEVSPTTAPILAGKQVIVQEGDDIVVRALAGGEPLARFDAEGVLVGADGSGERSVISILHGEDHGSRASVVMVASGSVRWKVELNLPAGRPAIMGEYVIAPWATHRISILDASDGAERVRWFFTGTVLGHAQAIDDRVYVGQHGWLPVTANLLSVKADELQPLSPLPRQLPGQPHLMRDGYAAYPPPSSAEHRLRMHWRVGTEHDIPVLGDQTYLRFYRFVFAMRASADELRWVRQFEHDLVGAAQTETGLWVADATGTLSFLGADGSLGSAIQLGQPLSMVIVRGQPGPQALTRAPAGADRPPLGDMKAQLSNVAKVDDTRLGAARAYAVQRLAAFQDADVTQTLVDLCMAHGSPELVHSAACHALESRRSGHQYVLAALKRRSGGPDKRVRIGSLAMIAGDLGLRQAVPSMLDHFEDLRTDASDLVPLADALAALGSPKAVPVLERFVRIHHGEPAGSPVLPAVTRSIATLGELRAARSKKLLAHIADDGLACEAVRDAAARALTRMAAPPPPKKTAEPKPQAEPLAPPVDPLPARVEAGTIDRVLKPVSAKLRRCLRDGGKVASARLAMVVTGAGNIEGVFVTPAQLQSCIEPIIRTRSFPATRAGRQRLIHVVSAKAARPGKRARKARR